MIGPAYKQSAAQAVFGSSRSLLIPGGLWLGWLDDAGVELGTERFPVENSDAVFGPVGDGVANVAPIDGGLAGGVWQIAGAGLWDSPTDGSILATATLSAPQTTALDDALVIDVGGLVLEVA